MGLRGRTRVRPRRSVPSLISHTTTNTINTPPPSIPMTRPRDPTIHRKSKIARTAIVDAIPPGASKDEPEPTWVEEGASIGEFTIVYHGTMIEARAQIGSHCTIGPDVVVGEDAVVSPGCIIEAGAIVKTGAHLDPGCVIAPGCVVGKGAYRGPGVRLLDQPRLPDKGPGRISEVRANARVGGGAVVCGGNTVGEDAYVAAGEVVEDDVPDDGVWMGGRVATVFEY